MCIFCVPLGMAHAHAFRDAPLPVSYDASGEPVDVPFSPGADGATCLLPGLACGVECPLATQFLAEPLAALGGALAAVNVDGAGSCLFAAASRSLVGSEILTATLRQRTYAELAQHEEYYAALPQGRTGATLGDLGDVATTLAILTPSWALWQTSSTELAVLALASVLRRPILRLSSAAFVNATPATFLPRRGTPALGDRAPARRPLLLAWAYVAAGGTVPEHYAALQRRATGPGAATPLALPQELRPKSWPQEEDVGADDVDWLNVAPLPPPGWPGGDDGAPLSASGFATGAALPILLQELASWAHEELVAAGPTLAACAGQGYYAVALDAPDALMRLFYFACGLEESLSGGVLLPAGEILTALRTPSGGTVGAAVASAFRQALVGTPATTSEAPSAALMARLWRLGHQRHVFLKSAYACRAGCTQATLDLQTAAANHALANALTYEALLPFPIPADAWAAMDRDAVLAGLHRTDSDTAADATANAPLGPSASLAAAQALVHPGARLAAVRASKMLRQHCAAAGVADLGAMSDDAVEDVMVALCLSPAEDEAGRVDAVAQALRAHGLLRA